MNRCLELAKKGLGNTYPNPLVGAVIVFNNKIIGEGYHTQAGKNHAEINAIENVKDKNLLKKATLYVNLEPCSHHGRTPPCAEKIAQLKIPKVYIGTIDTTDKVAGKGIQILKNAGIDVKTGILEQKCRQLNKRFFTFHEKKRPYITLKWAQTLDGFIDINRTSETPIQPNWITGKTERTLVHKWRTQEQAILIGTKTAEKDNPQLTARNWHGNNPIRLIIDKKLRLMKNLNIFKPQAKTIIFNNVIELEQNENLKFVKISRKKDTIEQILSYLYKKNIQSIFVEGGKILLQSLIDNENYDQAKIFIGNKTFNEGVKAPKLSNFVKKIQYKMPNSTLFVVTK